MSFPTRERGLKLFRTSLAQCPVIVVPHAGTWIEIWHDLLTNYDKPVVPHAGTWIEIMINPQTVDTDTWSFPTRERGLKYNWRFNLADCVASFPTRERGLKLLPCACISESIHVVPHAGTWIEIEKRD